MDREEIIRMAREAGLAYGSDEKPLNSVTRFAALVAATERNKLAAWMMSQGYATGHGDTIEDMLHELEWQIREQEREACAAMAEAFHHHQYDFTGNLELHEAIRARGEK
jgi:hypothetical protein